MDEEVYRRLAKTLDAIPLGLHSTESGAELRLLAKVFSPQEAALAVAMCATPEPASVIATRAGVPSAAAEQVLEQMASRGLVRTRESDGRCTYELVPFIGNSFERQLPWMDVELAELFERYYLEAQGGSIVRDSPPMHRVLPVEEAVPLDLEILPYERASALVKQAGSWAVRDCVCRVQQRLVGKGCDHPLEVCLWFAPVEGVRGVPGVDRPITEAEALDVLRQAREAGLVHCTYNYREGTYHICNCCTCGCVMLRGVVEFGHLTAVARSDFRATVDVEACIGCGECVARCQFGALSVTDESATEGPGQRCVVDGSRCLGCGLCIVVCPSGALHLERLSDAEKSPPLADRREWNVRRARERGLPAVDVR